MDKYSEKRSDERRDYKSPVMVGNPEAGAISRARMTNYSKNGLFLETNADFEPETEVYMGIENSPYSYCLCIISAFPLMVVPSAKLPSSVA